MRSMLKVVHDEGLGGVPVGLRSLAQKYDVTSLIAMVVAHDRERNRRFGPFEFNAPIISGGLAALGGWVKVTLNPDGSVRWQGEATNSGVDSYDFGISALVKAHGGRTVALAHSGSIPNRVPLIGDTIRRSWDKTHPPDALLAAKLGDFSDAQFQTHLEYTSGIEAALEAALGWLIKFGVGTVLGPGVGAVIFVGVEIGSLISTGSLVPGARIVGDILWMAGPANTLFAIAAEGIASLGSQTREITQVEYDWANDRVFFGSLPPREKIVLTDTIGGDNRAFTFPRFDGKITLNMGSAAFADPRNCPGAPWGNVFIHELVHACQIQHTNLDVALLADAFASKVCEATQGVNAAYTYGPAGPDYSSFSLEQQAQIVSNWFSSYFTKDKSDDNYGLNSQSATSDPYFRYITDNVRVGRF